MMQGHDRDGLQVLGWLMARDVHEYMDTGGRPVGEGRAAAFRRVNTEMRTCPYAGSRHRHAKPMNVSALQHLPEWRQVLTLLSWFAERHRAAHRRQIKTAEDLAQVTGAGMFLVDFLVLRRNQPLRSGEIPVLVAGLYKVCLGLQLAYLVERFAAPDAPTELPDAAGFLDYLEGNELLIGEAEVCAGSPAMILQAYDAIVGGRGVAMADLPAPCANLQIDWDRFDVFADRAAAIWRSLAVYAVRMPQFQPRLADSRLPADLQAGINARLERHGKKLLDGQAGLVVDIARGVREFAASGDDARPAQRSPADRPPTDSRPRPGSVAALVVAWLRETAGEEIAAYESVIASSLEHTVGRYEEFEAGLLNELNRLMGDLLRALGFTHSGALTPSALGYVCRRTWRDWAATHAGP